MPDLSRILKKRRDEERNWQANQLDTPTSLSIYAQNSIAATCTTDPTTIIEKAVALGMQTNLVVHITFVATVGAGVAPVTITIGTYLDDVLQQVCTPTNTLTAQGTFLVSFAYTLPMISPGDHNMKIKVNTNAGNITVAQYQAWLTIVAQGMQEQQIEMNPEVLIELPVPVPILEILTAAINGVAESVAVNLNMPAAPIIEMLATAINGDDEAEIFELNLPVPTLTVSALLTDQQYKTGDDVGLDIYDTQWRCQTFTPAFNHTIKEIALKLYRGATDQPGNVIVALYATDGTGKPTSDALDSVTIDGDYLPTTAFKKYYEGFNLAVTMGTKYAIVVSAPAGSSTHKAYVRVDQTSPTYAGGSAGVSADSGATWTMETTRDFVFEESGTV